MESLSREEFLDTYPLGTGMPKDDMLFLGQMVGYSKEERLLILQEVKKGKGISSKRLAEIVGGTYKGIGYESSRISMAYQGSRGHMSMGEIAATAAANGIQQVQTAFNMAVMPVALQAIYDNTNPPPSNVSLDPRVGMDLQEIQINKRYPIEAMLPRGVNTTGTNGTRNSKVGDFTNLKGTDVDDILDRIPDDAVLRELYPVQGGATEGFEFKWTQDGQTYRVRVHNIDPGAPAGSYASEGWVARIQRGKQYYDFTIDDFQPAKYTNPKGDFFDEGIMNNTHIPIQDPYTQ